MDNEKVASALLWVALVAIAGVSVWITAQWSWTGAAVVGALELGTLAGLLGDAGWTWKW